MESRKRIGHIRKKHVALAVALISCAAVLGTGTLAYFTAEETARHTITMNTLSMRLICEEDISRTWNESDDTLVYPGATLQRRAFVLNQGGVDFYVRISVEKTLTPAEGVEATLNTDYVHISYNTESWIDGGDGYFYYQEAIAPFETTTALFTGITFDTEMDNAYMDAQLELVINAQVVQSSNNADNVLDAVGWTTMGGVAE